MKQLLLELGAVVWPLISLFITLVGAAIVPFLAGRLIKRLGIENADKKAEVEAKLREALHQSGQNALMFALSKAGYASPLSVSNLVHNAPLDPKVKAKLDAVVQSAVKDYLIPKMPGTIKKTKASETDLEDIVISKLFGLTEKAL